jgi:hypothetical protein
MKWLMMLVAIVLGAGITWLLTVRRVTRKVITPGAAASEAPGDQAAPGGPAAGVPGVTDVAGEGGDDAAGFGGPVAREASSGLGWDRTSQDEDALFPHEAPELRAGVGQAPPIAAATAAGDVAGVTAPRSPEARPDDGDAAGAAGKP